MAGVRAFTSFDFDHDDDLRTLLMGQSKSPDTPFEIVDFSLKQALTGDWKAKIRERIKMVDQVIVLCGTHTHQAAGVSAEVEIARDARKPYFLLKGRKDQTCYAPNAAAGEKMYNWTWENLKLLLAGSR